MKILYSKKRRKYDLFYIIFCLLIGMLSLFLSETNHMFIYLYMPLGFISLYRYIGVKYYLIIEKGILKQNYIFGKKMKLSEIKSIKHFAREYILRTDTRKMIINLSWVDQNSHSELKGELKRLKAQWV